MKINQAVRNIVLPAVGLMTASSAMGAELVAPSEQYPTIRSAMTSAEDGDVVTVLPGVHVEDFWMTGSDGCRSFTLRGTGHPSQTVLKRTGSGRFSVSGSVCGEDRRDSVRYTIENLTFEANASRSRFKDGLNISHCTVTFRNCDFRNITSHYFQGQRPRGSDSHGALEIYNCNAHFEHCNFVGNGVTYTRQTYLSSIQGGAIWAFDSDLEILNSAFLGNYVRTTDGNGAQAATTAALGGAVYARKGSLYIEDSRFEANSVSDLLGMTRPDQLRGGAVYAESLDLVRLRNNVFRGNRAESSVSSKWNVGMGGAVFITNADSNEAAYTVGNTFIQNHADHTGGAIHGEGAALLKASGDYYECNTVTQVSGSWLDRGGNAFVECDPACMADVNADGSVDKADLIEVINHFGPAKDGSPYDLNGDGVVDYNDFFLVLSTLGGCDK